MKTERYLVNSDDPYMAVLLLLTEGRTECEVNEIGSNLVYYDNTPKTKVYSSRFTGQHGIHGFDVYVQQYDPDLGMLQIDVIEEISL